MGIGKAVKNVVFVDTLDKFYAYGGFGLYNGRNESITMTDKPLVISVVKKDSTKKDSVSSFSPVQKKSEKELKKEAKELKKAEKEEQKDKEKNNNAEVVTDKDPKKTVAENKNVIGKDEKLKENYSAVIRSESRFKAEQTKIISKVRDGFCFYDCRHPILTNDLPARLYRAGF